MLVLQTTNFELYLSELVLRRNVLQLHAIHAGVGRHSCRAEWLRPAQVVRVLVREVDHPLAGQAGQERPVLHSEHRAQDPLPRDRGDGSRVRGQTHGCGSGASRR